jgi:hypothetical protein
MVSQPPPHAACGPIPLVPAKAGPRIRMMDWIPNISAFTRVSMRYARE